MGISNNSGCPFGGPYNKDYSILGSILGSPHFGKPSNSPNIDRYPNNGESAGKANGA